MKFIILISAEGNVQYTTVVPDTITSWILNAFSISEDLGIGIAETKKVRFLDTAIFSLIV